MIHFKNYPKHKSNMLRHPQTFGESKPKDIPLLKFNITFIFFFLIIINGKPSNAEGSITNIVAILDSNTRMGKEQKMGIDVAVARFNKSDSALKLNHSLSLNFIEFNGSLLQTALEAETLIKEDKAQVIIIGVENWQAIALVAQVGNQSQIPVLSLASSHPITPQFTSKQWPFLIQMSYYDTQDIQNLATIIQVYHWRRIILVYEDGLSDSDNGMLSLLINKFQDIGSQIEYQLVLPPSVSTTNLKGVIQEGLTKFVNESCYSRVFIVVKVSSPYVKHLFMEAKDMELMGNDSIWITSQHVTNLLPYLDYSTLLSMEGVLGIMTMFDNTTKPFQEFQAQFWTNFSKEFPQEDNYEPGLHALVANDAINTVSNAINISHIRNNTNFKEDFRHAILQINFIGLSGRISFEEDHNTLKEAPNTSIVNIVGGTYREILSFASKDIEDDEMIKEMASQVTWPGNSIGIVPKGWRMPTQKKRMKIGVPIAHDYFIDFPVNQRDFLANQSCSSNEIVSHKDELFSGFCIELFQSVLGLLDYHLPHEFIPCSDSYDDLVKLVHDKVLDAIVGDVTILVNRSNDVDFTLPFQESALSIVLQTYEPKYKRPWIFLSPFTWQLWVVTLGVLVYTMFIVWFLEHRENEDFRGPWRTQLGTTVWFTFSSLYFAQRERVSSGLARVVVVTWMFIVLVLTQSYTANLSSILTNQRLNQTTIDIEMLRSSNATVGYDNASFVNEFLEDLFEFNASNINKSLNSFEDFHNAFKAESITAAFLELIYARLFVTKYCTQYTITNTGYRYGGLAFVFPKGSPVAIDVSQAILTLTENGTLTNLTETWKLDSKNDCYITDDIIDDSGDTRSFSPKEFWVLFVFSTVTTTICFLASFITSYTNRWRRITPSQSVATTN